MSLRFLGFSLLCGYLLSACASFSAAPDSRFLVHSQEEYKRVVKDLSPGDTVVLANGIWKDFEILFTGEGSTDKPITLTGEEYGKVILSGQSNLRIAGNHIVVSGLVFKDGHTPTDSIISFRKDANFFANHSRITQVVIDNFNNPERTETDYWISMYGKHNRFDHNHIVGKRNRGVTMAVRLNSDSSQKNFHSIDHNYFGPRPILGSNGGETLRIGTSHYSLADSNTTVENNYFDRCDGELEIISSKSAGNVIRGNVFYESRGTLTLRHGRNNIVENNVFFGNGVDHTGGIRVINADQTIRNNYMEGLAGYRFGGALVVMNGVPNSPINRYHQVENAQITNNTLVNSDHVQLAAGSDEERSAVPLNSSMVNNLFHSDASHDIFTVYDDIAGIEFRNNLLNRPSAVNGGEGFQTAQFNMQRASNGLLYPDAREFFEYGVTSDLKPVSKEETGVSWYPKPVKANRFGTGIAIEVPTEEGALAAAVKSSGAGDQLILSGGTHVVSRVVQVNHPLTIRSAEKSSQSQIAFERSTLFEIKDGGSLELKDISIIGDRSPDSAGNSVIRTQRSAMLENYELNIDGVDMSDLDINHSFNVLSAAKSTFADSIRIVDSSFSNVSGAILKLDAETDDYGIYNAEYVDIKNTLFENIRGTIVDYYRGGTDESTFGPHFSLASSELRSVGKGKRNKSAASVLLHGVQVSSVRENTVTDSQPIKVFHTVGEPVTRIIANEFISTPRTSVTELNSGEVDTAHVADNRYRER